MILLLFWPALILALVLSILGISYRAPGLLVVAALLTVPTSLYIGLGGALPGGVLVALLPLFPAMGAFAVRTGHRGLAALLVLVPVGFFSWFGRNVARQDPNAPLPAGPTLSVAGTPIPAVRNAHCWEQRGGRVCADGLTAPATIAAKGLKPTTVPAGSFLDVDFAVPPRRFQVHRWIGDRPDPVELADDRVPLPRQPGLYTYSITAAWPRRAAAYTFLVQVR